MQQIAVIRLVEWRCSKSLISPLIQLITPLVASSLLRQTFCNVAAASFEQINLHTVPRYFSAAGLHRVVATQVYTAVCYSAIFLSLFLGRTGQRGLSLY